MSFTWTISRSVGSTIEPAEINEIKTNIDTLLTSLSLSFSWTSLPVAQGDYINIGDLSDDLRDSLDYVDDNNFCSAVQATNNTSVNSTNNATVQSTNNSSVTSCSYNANIYCGPG